MLTILKNWHFIIIGVFCIYIGFLHVENSLLRDRIAIVQKEVALNEQLIKEQNGAIEKWKEEGIALEKEVKLKEKEYSAAARMSDKRANQILNKKIPSDCNGAIRWFLENKKILY